MLSLCANGTNLVICGLSQSKAGLVLDRYTYGNRNALTFASRTSLHELSQEVSPQWVSLFYLTPTRLVLVHRDAFVLFDAVYGCEVKASKQQKAASLIKSCCTNTDFFGLLDLDDEATFYDKYGRKQSTLRSRLLSQEKTAALNQTLSKAAPKEELAREQDLRSRGKTAHLEASLHYDTFPYSSSALKDRSFLDASLRNSFAKSPAPDSRSHRKTFTAGATDPSRTAVEASKAPESAKHASPPNFGTNIKYYRRPF